MAAMTPNTIYCKEAKMLTAMVFSLCMAAQVEYMVIDLRTLMRYWMIDSTAPGWDEYYWVADLNDDGIVNFLDYAIFEGG